MLAIARIPLRLALIGAICVLVSTSGCHAIHRALAPALPASDATEAARVELRVIPEADLLQRDRDVAKLMRSMSVTPKAISELATRFTTQEEGAPEPSEADLAKLQRAHAELVTVNRKLAELDREGVPFRGRGTNEPHADFARARSAFYACLGLTDAYALHPQLSAFEPSNGVAHDDPLDSRGIVEGRRHHGVDYVMLAPTDLTRRVRGAKRPRRHARILELRRSFEQDGGETLALRMHFRVDMDEWGHALQLVPTYLRVDRSYVRVAGLGVTPWYAARGWLYPWMWLHGLAELRHPELTSISLDARIRIESISAADDEVVMNPLGEARFLIENLGLRDLPIERSCASATTGIPELPSPYLALPRTQDVSRTPVNVSAVVHERRSRSRRGGWGARHANAASSHPVAVPAFDPAAEPEHGEE